MVHCESAEPRVQDEHVRVLSIHSFHSPKFEGRAVQLHHFAIRLYPLLAHLVTSTRTKKGPNNDDTVVRRVEAVERVGSHFKNQSGAIKLRGWTHSEGVQT